MTGSEQHRAHRVTTIRLVSPSPTHVPNAAAPVFFIVLIILVELIHA